MGRSREDLPAVKVYTVCDESRYLIVRNVPALGCDDELLKLFASYGDVEDCKPMDGEDCEPFTDVYWIKFRLVCNARFAKRKLDEFVFLGNRLQVSYAPQFENLYDTKDKLEGRRNGVLTRLNLGRSKGSKTHTKDTMDGKFLAGSPSKIDATSQQLRYDQKWGFVKSEQMPLTSGSSVTQISFDQDYFLSPSINHAVQLVRAKLDKIESSGKHQESGTASKKPRVDNRRRI